MVAMNSIPQQEVANGNGHKECDLASPTTLSIDVAKKPDPSIPGGASTIFTSLIIFQKKKLNSDKSKMSPNLRNLMFSIV
jgi:hypothetical protein